MSSDGRTKASSDLPSAQHVQRPATGAARGAVCHSLRDAYSLASRRTIRSVLRSWLHKTELTPVELLHHPDHLRKLEDSGTILQSAVQRAGMAQAKQGGESLHERQRVLYGLFDEVHRSATLLWRDRERPQLSSPDAAGIAALVKQVSPRENGDFLFNAAIADWLSDTPTLGKKLKRLAALVVAAPTGAARRRVEEFALDFFEDSAALSELLTVNDEPDIMVLRIGELLAANQSSWFRSDRVLVRFHKLLGSGELPVCRTALFERLVQILENPRGICRSDAFLELQLLGRLRSLLDGCIGDGDHFARLEEAFVQRSSRYLSSYEIDKILADCVSKEKQLTKLLQLEPGVAGARNKRALADRMLEILVNRECATELTRSDGAPAVRLRALAEMQQRIKDTAFPPAAKTQMMDVLDRISLHLAKQIKFFDRLSSKSRSEVDEAIVLMRLCAAGTFTEGATLDAARQRASRLLQSPSFMSEYFGGAGKSVQRRERLQSLVTHIVEAGLPDSPVSAALIKASGEHAAAGERAAKAAQASTVPRRAAVDLSRNRTVERSTRHTADAALDCAGAVGAVPSFADSDPVRA